MAIIIDTNCLSAVFNSTDKEHSEFYPVLDWILYGHGFVVYGGTKYMKELSKTKYLRIFKLLNDLNKTYRGCDICIDEYEQKYKASISDPDFDDPHLPAIVLDTKCRLICSKDARSIKFVTSKDLYPPKFHTPVYYDGLRCQTLLIDKNIDKRLKGYRHLLNKKEKDALSSFIDGLK